MMDNQYTLSFHCIQYRVVLFFFFCILACTTPLHAYAQADGCTQTPIGGSVLRTLGSATVGNNPLAAQAQTAAAIQATICSPIPRIKIPGLTFTSAEDIAKNTYTDTATGEVYMFVPFLGEYIAAVYRYGVALAGVVIVIIIIVSGIQWTLGGASPDSIDAAKERIRNALIGMGIIAGSFTVLYIINPQLTSFQSLRIKIQEPQEIVSPNEDLSAEAATYASWANTARTQTASNGASTIQPGTIPLFLQYEYRTPYPPCGTIAAQGCAPTSLAMILSGLGFSDATPITIANLWQSTGHRRCPPGDNEANNCANCETYHSFLREPQFLSRYPVTVTSLGPDRARITATLQAGTPIMVSMSQGRFSSGGHFIVLAGINPDGSIIINDPGRNPNTPYCRDHDKNSCKQAGHESEQIYPRTGVPADIVFQDVSRAYAITKN